MVVQIEDREHARLSPSSAERQIECTKSVALSASLPPSLPTPDAAAGTVGHALFERCLREGIDTFELPVGAVEVDGHRVEVDDGMLDLVQGAVDWAREHVPRPWLLEHRVSFPFVEAALGEPMWGFLDVGCRAPFYVADLKMGFQPVAPDAVQLRLYLMGLALEGNPGLEGAGPAGVAAVIQPRATTAEHEVSWQDLRDLRDWLIDGMRRIRRRDYSYAHGPWCSWCPAAGACPHLAAVARDSALARATPTIELVASGEFSADLLNEALNLAPRVEQWLKAVNEVARQYLVHGGQLADHVLVERRTNRRWVDEAAVAARLVELGADPWTEPKLVSPAEAERRLPKSKRGVVGELAEKPPGELTVAPRATTKKPAVDYVAMAEAALQSNRAAALIEKRKDATR